MTERTTLYNILAAAAVSLIVFLALLYAAVVYVFDSTTLLLCVVLPLILGSAIFAARKDRVLLFSFLAYFWTIVDDRPVFFDSVLTWPEVTRFHPFLPRLFMNIVIHALTALFLYLAVRESMKGSGVRLRNAPSVIALASAAFILAYAQNIPLAAIQNFVATSWYPFDIAEKLLSFFFFYLAFRQATKLKMSGDEKEAAQASASPHSAG